MKQIANDSVSTAKLWDAQWRHYNLDPFFKPNQKVISEICRCFKYNLKNKNILELGAGSGCDILSLSKMGANGYAVDFSSESIKTIAYWSKKTKTKVQSSQSSIQNLPYKNPMFDMVYSVGLMEHFQNPLQLLINQKKLIKKNGFLLIDVPQKYTLYTLAKHIRMKLKCHPFGWETEYSKNELSILAKKIDMKIVKFYGRDLDLIQKIPDPAGKIVNSLYQKTIENTIISPYISLSIGVILQK